MISFLLKMTILPLKMTSFVTGEFLVESIGEAVGTRTRADVVAAVSAAGVPCAPVNSCKKRHTQSPS